MPSIQAQQPPRISALTAPTGSASTWRLDVIGQPAQPFAIEQSLDLKVWQPLLGNLTATGAIQTFNVSPPGALKGFFRVVGNASIDISGWDLSAEPGPYGAMVVSVAGDFVAAELVEKSNGAVTRRPAGVHIVDSVSGSSLMLHLGANNVPDFLILNSDVVIEFISSNAATRMVTWRVKDLQGVIISQPKTDLAPDGFFSGIATGLATMDNPGNTTLPQIKAVVEGTINLMGAAGTKADSKASVIINTLGILAAPVGVVMELGVDPGKVVAGTKWGVDAAQCGLFLSEMAVAPTPAGPAAWGLLAAEAVPGLLACRDTIKPVVESITDLALQNLEAKQLAAEMVRLANVAFQASGSFITTQMVSPYSYLISRRQDFFVQMNRCRSFMREAQDVIDTKFPPLSPDKDAAQASLDTMMQSYQSKVTEVATAAQAMLEGSQSSLSTSQSTLPGAQQSCNGGSSSGCSLVQICQELISAEQKNIPIEQGLLLSISKL